MVNGEGNTISEVDPNTSNDTADVTSILNQSICILSKMGGAFYSRSRTEEDLCRHNREECDQESMNSTGEVISAESSCIILLQVLIPFLFAGFGMVIAGIVLDAVQSWELFTQVPETFILVPALLGLKGNLEMTLASRMSTLANVGQLNSRESCSAAITSNLSLVQVQAIIVAFLASVVAAILAWIPKGHVDWAHVALLCASSLATASLASLILSSITIGVVLISKRASINPDNVTTPIAASLGDLITLGVLSLLGSWFLKAHLTESWLNVIVIVVFFLLAPLLTLPVRANHSAIDALRNGWMPIITSMFISSCGGLILKMAIRSFPQIALLQPLINGVGGNLAAVHASRLTTSFYMTSELGVLPCEWNIARFISFRRAFLSSDLDSQSARVLLLLVLPGHICFLFLLRFFYGGDISSFTSIFIVLYLFAAFIQVVLLLYICQGLVAFMWTRQINPDNAVIPYLTALGDLFGTFLLYLTFSLMKVFQ